MSVAVAVDAAAGTVLLETTEHPRVGERVRAVLVGAGLPDGDGYQHTSLAGEGKALGSLGASLGLGHGTLLGWLVVPTLHPRSAHVKDFGRAKRVKICVVVL